MICVLAAAVGSWFTGASVKSWYPTLLKPADTPPAWVFGPVWSTLYVLMATAAWLVWRQRPAPGLPAALKQLVDKHGGWIHVRSSSTNNGRRGTTFMVVLPAAIRQTQVYLLPSRLTRWSGRSF